MHLLLFIASHRQYLITKFIRKFLLDTALRGQHLSLICISCANPELLSALREATAAMRLFSRRVRQFARDHPYWTAAIIVGLIFGGVVLVAPHAVLGLLGFHAVGVSAGTATIYFLISIVNFIASSKFLTKFIQGASLPLSSLSSMARLLPACLPA